MEMPFTLVSQYLMDPTIPWRWNFIFCVYIKISIKRQALILNICFFKEFSISCKNLKLSTLKEGRNTLTYKSPLLSLFVITKLCPTLCDPMDCSTSGFPVLHYLLEFPQTHVHRADAIQLSHPLSHPFPHALNLS